MTEVNNNRDNLIIMMAISEDIYRTNNRIYELLRGLMSNPHELTNIKKSIDNLYEKVTALKNSDIEIPFVEEENVIVPSLEDISPKQDVEYEKLVQTPSEPEEEVVEEEEVEEEVVEEEEEVEELVVEKPPRRTRKPRENVRGRRPRKPLKNKKKLPSPDIDSI
jgi:hypothetical protein